MKLSKTSGSVLAAAAAVLMLSGAAVTTASAAGEDAKIQCFGANSCKGTSACKTANSACKGQNACKGQGFLSLTSAECTEKGGRLTEMMEKKMKK